MFNDKEPCCLHQNPERCCHQFQRITDLHLVFLEDPTLCQKISKYILTCVCFREDVSNSYWWHETSQGFSQQLRQAFPSHSDEMLEQELGKVCAMSINFWKQGMHFHPYGIWKHEELKEAWFLLIPTFVGEEQLNELAEVLTAIQVKRIFTVKKESALETCIYT